MKHIVTMLFCVLILKLFVHAQTTNTLTDVEMSDANRGVAVGFSGTILTTNDGGVTWTTQSSGTTNNLYSVSVFSLYSTAVGGDPLFGGGRVLRSTNNGSSWSMQSSGTGSLLLGISLPDASNGTAVGNNGAIVHTTNGGATWTSQSSGTTNHLYETQFVDANNGLVSGSQGTILRTVDGGATWVKQTTGTPYSLYGVSFVSSSVGTVVGDAGTILRTLNGGSTWTAQSSGTTTILRSVSFVDANNGFAVGDGGTILHTTNGGSSWASQLSGTPYSINCVSVINANTAIAVGYGGMILKTTNGGATWGPPSGGGGSPTPPSAPTLSSPTNGATNQPILLTLSWNASSGATSYRLQVSTSSSYGTTVVDDSTLTSTSRQVSGLSNSTTYYWRMNAKNSAGTSAYSSTWSFATSVPPPASPVFSVTPTSINFGTVVVGKSATSSVTVTNTGGSTLTISNIVSTSSKYTVSPTSGSIAAGASMAVNITFTPTNKTTVTANINFTHNAAGSSGVVTVTGKGGSSSTKGPRKPSETVAGLPQEFALLQNYPNPFNPTTTITYDIIEPSHVRLSIFNVLGQEVAALVDGDVEAGSHSITWNSSNTEGLQLSSGIYIYRMHITSLVNGQEFNQIKRMMLIK